MSAKLTQLTTLLFLFTLTSCLSENIAETELEFGSVCEATGSCGDDFVGKSVDPSTLKLSMVEHQLITVAEDKVELDINGDDDLTTEGVKQSYDCHLVEDQLSRFHKYALGKDISHGELKGLYKQLITNSNIKALGNEYSLKSDFLQKYGNLSNEDFIKKVYQEVLLREPGATGLNPVLSLL